MSVKFFHEHPQNPHLDKRFANIKNINIHDHLYQLLDRFDKFVQHHEASFWLDYGSALGVYRVECILPHDDDIDLGMIKTEFNKLPDLWESDTFLWEKNPYAVTLDRFDEHNTVAARFICKRTGIFLDVFLYEVTETGIMYNNESMRNSELWVQHDDVFPLVKRRFGDHMYHTPKHLEIYLLRYYNNDLSIPPQFLHYYQ